MFGRNPPVITYVVPIQNGAQVQGGGAQVFQALPVSHNSNQVWASPRPGDQTRVMPPGHVPAQSQYAQYGVVPQQLAHQQPQQQLQIWNAPVQAQVPHTPQRVVTQNQWHVPQHRQVYGQGYTGIASQQPQQRQQQQPQRHGVAVAVFQSLARQHQHQQWGSQQATSINPASPNPGAQNLGPNVGRIPRPIHQGSPFGSLENGTRGRPQNLQQPNGHHRSQAKQKRWPKNAGGDTTPHKQHTTQPELSSSLGKAGTELGPNGTDRGAAASSSGGAAVEASWGEVGSSEPFFCEPCEKDFASEAARQAHLQSHEKCSEPGCNFSASRKVLNAHHSAAHGQFSGTGFQTITVEGQKFRVLLGTSPEDVEEWRAARRKHWPSDKTVARREEEERKRRELGGLGPDSLYGGRGGRGGRGRGSKHGRGRGGGGRGEHECTDILRVYSPGDGAAQAGITTASDVAVTGKRPCEESSAETTLKVPRIEGKETRADASEQGIGSASTAASTSAGGEEAEDGEGKVSAEDGVTPGRRGRKRICVFYLKGKCTKGEECSFGHDVARKNCRCGDPVGCT